MGKRIVKSVIITFGILVFLLSAVYLGLAEYYRGGFSCGTFINGVYCTGKTVEEVNRELLKGCSYDGLTIYGGNGEAFYIRAEELDFSFDFTGALTVWLAGQNPWLWINNLFYAADRELAPVISYDRERVYEELAELSLFAEEPEERRVCVIKTPKGYSLLNERKDVLDREAAINAVIKALDGFQTGVDLVEEGCYRDIPLTEEMKEELARWEKIREFQDCHIIYRFGEEQVPVDASVVCDWVDIDRDGGFVYEEDGSLRVDEKKIEEYVDRLADKFDTVGGVRQFQATRGETVTVKGGTYGNRMDRKAEKEYLIQAFKDKVTQIHTPKYLQKAWKQGREDIGSTYIEVDMTQQMMYYYENGRLMLKTPVVTGNTGRKMGTPEGVDYVYSRQENRVLRGPNYASHVDFWMPVRGNIGIHDAGWRKEFGGEIYKTDGSHGCINTPHDAMKELYGMVKTGVPVVMFY